LENHVIVTNPPYGIRMGDDVDLEAFYRNLGDFLKQKCKGSAAFVYFGERKYIKNIGLKASWKKPLKAGGLDGRLVKYALY
jgi:putative N6-adenine-specific DNA methylase